MMTISLKRFLIVSLLTVTGIATAMACGPWARPHYYVFSAYQRNQVGNTFSGRMCQFWYDYAPETRENPYLISGLSGISDEDFETTDNAIVKTARDKNDKEMLRYLRSLIKYLQISDDVAGDEWDYPSKERLAQRHQTLKAINNEARVYGGKRLAGQYSLLAMRANMVMGEHAANIAYWNNNKDKLEPSVYKDMMKDIYAGALYNMGKLSEAAAIYHELGDMSSLMWIMRDQRNLKGIQKEYARDPNSPALIFLVQDIANNLSDTRYYQTKNEETENTAETVKEIKAFIDFAQQVVKENKTKSPALWQSAMGWLNHALGNDKVALEQLEKAMKMKGSDRMIDNARVCRLVTTVESETPSKKLYSFLMQEMQWMLKKEAAEPCDGGYYAENCQNHYTEVLQNIVFDHIAPAYAENGNVNVGTTLLWWMDNHLNQLGEYKTALDYLTSQQMIDYYKYINSKPQTDFEAWINKGNPLNADIYNDMVGTKLIREGRFAEAIPYLEKVSHDFLCTQAIAPYASARDYRVPMCLKRQYNDAGFSNEKYDLKSNQKLDFCKEMVAHAQALNTLPNGAKKAEVAYLMANMYLQASYKGNCWYLSRYGVSAYDSMCYTDEMDFLAEASRLLAISLSQPNVTHDKKQLYTYAAAFLPYGNDLFSERYDSNYNCYLVVNKDVPRYNAMMKLLDFVKANPNNLATYVSRCDVLKKFRAAL